MSEAQYSSLCFHNELLVLSYPGLSANVVTFTSSTLGGSSIGFPLRAKKSWVRASRISEQKTLSSWISPFSGSVHLTIGISMWIILNLFGRPIYKSNVERKSLSLLVLLRPAVAAPKHPEILRELYNQCIGCRQGQTLARSHRKGRNPRQLYLGNNIKYFTVSNLSKHFYFILWCDRISDILIEKLDLLYKFY